MATTATDQIASHGTDADPSSDPLPKPVRLLAGAAAVALVGVSGWWLSRAVMIALAPESQWVAPLPVRSVAVVQRTLPALNTEFDAFHRGTPAVEDDEPEDMGADAPETTLNLTLKGHRAGPDGAAIIQTPDRSQRNYYVGEQIMSGVTLESVGRGFVVIERSGQLERLSLRDDGELFGASGAGSANPSRPSTPPALNTRPRRTAGGGLTPPPPNTVTPRQRTGRTEPPVPKPEPDPSGSEPRSEPESTPQSEPKSSPGPKPDVSVPLPDRSSVVAGDLLQNVSLTPVREDGRIKGFRITAQRGADLSQFGLKSGDIVTKVNGQSLGSGPDGSRPDMGALFQQLQQRSSATLVLERDGALMTVRIGN